MVAPTGEAARITPQQAGREGQVRCLALCMDTLSACWCCSCVHVCRRVAVDLGMEPGWPVVDQAYKSLLNFVRDRS